MNTLLRLRSCWVSRCRATAVAAACRMSKSAAKSFRQTTRRFARATTASSNRRCGLAGRSQTDGLAAAGTAVDSRHIRRSARGMWRWSYVSVVVVLYRKQFGFQASAALSVVNPRYKPIFAAVSVIVTAPKAFQESGENFQHDYSDIFAIRRSMRSSAAATRFVSSSADFITAVGRGVAPGGLRLCMVFDSPAPGTGA